MSTPIPQSNRRRTNQLIEFLQKTLAISNQELAVVMRDPDLDANSLAILLWKYGLISVEQLSLIFDWFEHKLTPCPMLQYVEVTHQCPPTVLPTISSHPHY
ncbi:MAG: DUF2949 domain-containing protein [Leptolyngbyaceae bacterium]|nr:DUF2949 domain-containing protein [Leptolyngbyaceae bacterium]